MSAAPPRARIPRGAALRGEKMAMRERCIAARDAMPLQERECASRLIAGRVAELAAFRTAATVLLTVSFRTEWNTAPLVDAALADGKRVVLPRVDTSSRMLALHEIADPARDVIAGYRGIGEPRTTCPSVAHRDVAFVLVPGIAFDLTGARLGYGGGYYDRLLPLLPPDAVRVAGLFELQLVDAVPMAPHDLNVDFLVTETRTLACPRERR